MEINDTATFLNTVIKPESAPAPRSGVVHSYLTMGDKYLSELRDDLGIAMPLSSFIMLRHHYRNVEKREAFYEEIYFFDALYTAAASSDTGITEFLTDDIFAAETFSDLAAKHFEVSKDKALPTLRDVFSAAGRYFRYAGRKTVFDNSHRLASGSDAALRLVASGVIPAALTDDGGAGVLYRPQRIKIKSGNLLTVISPAVAMPREEYAQALSRTYLSNPPSAVTKSVLLDKNGISGIIKEFSGLYINLSELPPGWMSIESRAIPCSGGIASVSGDNIVEANNGDTHSADKDGISTISPPGNSTSPKCAGYNPIEPYLRSAAGLVFAALDYTASSDFIRTAEANNLKVTIIGSTTSDSRITIRCGNGITFSFFSFLLASFPALPAKKIRLKPQSRGTRTPAAAGGSTYTPAPRRSRCYDTSSQIMLVTLNLDGIQQSTSSPYFTALDAILTAVAECVAAGSPFTEVVLSVAAKIPGSAGESADTALSLLLGAYRAQMEFCLSDTGSICSFESDTLGLTVSAAAGMTAQSVPSSFTTPGSSICLLSPHMCEDGLPDFEDLRRLWSYAESLIRDGRVLSAFAVGPLGVAASVADAAGDAVLEHINNDALNSSDFTSPAPGAIIVETANPTDGLFLGITRPSTIHLTI